MTVTLTHPVAISKNVWLLNFNQIFLSTSLKDGSYTKVDEELQTVEVMAPLRANLKHGGREIYNYSTCNADEEELNYVADAKNLPKNRYENLMVDSIHEDDFGDKCQLICDE